MSPGRVSIFEYLLFTLLLLPLFWLNLNGTHDWGGDFAQYIQQSVNIVNGVDHTQSNYVFNPDYPELAPPSYPAGFPLLLVPITAIWGINLLAYQYFLTTMLCGLALLTFGLLRHRFTRAEAGAAMLIFTYSPTVIRFKDEVLSDIPFTLLSLGAILLFIRWKRQVGRLISLIPVAFLLGFAFLHRNIGFVFLLAMLIDPGTKNVKASGILISGSIVLYLLFDQIIFPAKASLNGHFLDLFLAGGFRETINTTSEYYVTIFQNFFTPEGVELDFFPLVTRAFAIAFFTVGLFIRLLHRPSVLEWSTVGYLGGIFLFPNTTQGFRYLLPIFPLAFLYIITGLRSVRLPRKISPFWISMTALLAIGLPYQNYLKLALRADENHLGPQSHAAQEVFRFIENNTEEYAQFTFVKPRVLGLFADRQAFAQHPKKVLPASFDYLLTCNELTDPASEQFIAEQQDQLEIVFQNARFTLYRLKRLSDEEVSSS